MAIYTLLPKYVLDAKAQGMTDKSIAHVRLAVKLFAEFLGDIPDVRQVTDDDLRRFVVALQQKTKWVGLPQDKGQKLSGTSINTYVRGVKRYWSWLERKQIIQQNPLRSVVTPKLPNRLPKVLTEEQLEAIFKVIEAKDAHTLSFCGARDMAIFMLLLDSGIRLTELTALTQNDVDTKNGTLKVLGKGGRERVAFITHETASAIGFYCCFMRPKPRGENRLFLTLYGEPLTASRLQKVLERYGQRAGIPQRLSPHKLRHSCASLSLKNGANLEYLKRTLGHTDIKTTEIYLQVTNSDVSKAHEVFSPVTHMAFGKRKMRAQTR
jgi:integrase/recombinase XerD